MNGELGIPKSLKRNMIYIISSFPLSENLDAG